MSKIIKWLDNYWYHYKWRTIIIGFLLIVAILLTVQIVNRKQYDAYIMYLGDAAIPDTQYQEILSSFKKVASDFDNNGEILINFSKTAYISDEENEMASSVNSVAMNFMGSMIVQPYYLYLITDDVYEMYKDKDLFVSMDGIVDSIPDEIRYDDCAIIFSKTEFAKTNPGVDKFDEKTLLVIKNIPYSSSQSRTKAEKEAFDHHISILRAILAYSE